MKTYFDRKNGESAAAYLRRAVLTTTAWYVILGLPLLAFIGHSKGIAVVSYLTYRGPLLYVAVIVGMLAGRFLRGEFNQRRSPDQQTESK